MAHLLPLPEIGEDPELPEGDGLALSNDAGAADGGAACVGDAGAGAGASLTGAGAAGGALLAGGGGVALLVGAGAGAGA